MIVDTHVHFWEPAALGYPWLDEIPSLRRACLPPEYRAATGEVPVSKIVFVEANCRPADALREVAMIERLAAADARIAGIVAFADLTDARTLGATLDALARRPRVKGVRHNIQGHPAGFALRRDFVDGVREVGRRGGGFTFDLCATHDQLGDLVKLVGHCPDTRFVLDHCGKPPIRERLLEPWRADIAALAEYENVSCKVSGLLTEAGPDGWSDAALAPYVDWVVERFGTERVMYGSDWPVLTLADGYGAWYGYTERVTGAWSAADRSGFYGDNAARVYDL